MDPRAATGMLEALLSVAAFTTPFGLIVGICDWAGNHPVEHSNNTNTFFDMPSLILVPLWSAHCGESLLGPDRPLLKRHV
jgi:hypothetical protein